ncbi:hypothetical protein [Streptomyces sp. NPDC057280]|uniref:hypothetical protein n=1 Tax=Streptomyces sp. NPDC057280 TaxID=3346081 RepID=UPI00363045A3
MRIKVKTLLVTGAVLAAAGLTATTAVLVSGSDEGPRPVSAAEAQRMAVTRFRMYRASPSAVTVRVTTPTGTTVIRAVVDHRRHRAVGAYEAGDEAARGLLAWDMSGVAVARGGAAGAVRSGGSGELGGAGGSRRPGELGGPASGGEVGAVRSGESGGARGLGGSRGSGGPASGGEAGVVRSGESGGAGGSGRPRGLGGPASGGAAGVVRSGESGGVAAGADASVSAVLGSVRAVRAGGWTRRGFVGGPLDTGLRLVLGLAADRPDNAQLLAQSGPSWLRGDRIDGRPLDVFSGPRPRPQGSAPPAGRSPLAYWIDADGDLRRVTATLGTGRTVTVDVTAAHVTKGSLPEGPWKPRRH